MNIIIDDVMRLDSNGLLVYISRTKQNSAIKLRDFLKLIFMITNNKNDKKPRPQIKLRSYLKIVKEVEDADSIMSSPGMI